MTERKSAIGIDGATNDQPMFEPVAADRGPNPTEQQVIGRLVRTLAGTS